MDITAIAGQLAGVFVPLLPFLTGLGRAAAESAAERAGQQLGQDAFNGVAGLWDQVWPILRRRPQRATVQRLAEQPTADDRVELAASLADVLRSHPQLAAAAADLLRDHPHLGDRRWGDLAGAVTNGVVVQGDRNVTQTGDGNVSISAGRDVSVGAGWSERRA